MTKRNMSDSEIRHRKKIQAVTSQTTSTLGLAGATLGVGAIAASKGRSAPARLKQIRKLPGHKNITEQKLKDRGLYTSLISGGIGSVGGYNFASYTAAEGRKKKQIHKSNVSAFGVVHE